MPFSQGGAGGGWMRAARQINETGQRGSRKDRNGAKKKAESESGIAGLGGEAAEEWRDAFAGRSKG